MVGPADILNARVLIVDDHHANVLLLKLMLGHAGYTAVTSTQDPLEVCDLHRANHYDLILLDLRMPGMVSAEQPATPWYVSLWRRHRWLQLNLITAFIAAAVVGLFQETIDRLLILTMFLPVLAGQSGNTGSQALAVTLRSVFLGDL